MYNNLMESMGGIFSRDEKQSSLSSINPQLLLCIFLHSAKLMAFKDNMQDSYVSPVFFMCL